MKSINKLFTLCFALVLLTTLAFGQAVAPPDTKATKADEAKPASATAQGEWDWTIAVPDQPMQLAVKLKQEGEAVTGTLTSRLGETPVKNGKLTGDRLTFSIEVPVEGNQITASFTGNITGDQIKGLVETPMGAIEFSGTRKAAAAASLSGNWDLIVVTPNGALPITADFKQDGETITGTTTSQLGKADLTEGKLAGAKISFTYNVSYNGQTFPAKYAGTVEGDKMKGVVETPLGTFDFTGTRGKKTN